jgi:hypothetical protein
MPARKPARANNIVVRTNDAHASLVGRPPDLPEPYPPMLAVFLKSVANSAPAFDIIEIFKAPLRPVRAGKLWSGRPPNF